jgi:uncharacterized protein YdhG (YjbR/CyaY superfamily)
MAEKKPAKKVAQKSANDVFSDEEKAAARARVKEMKSAANKEDEERVALAAIRALPAPDRALAEGLHAIIKASAPALAPKTWYGMPAYYRDGKVVCHFQPAQKFKTRYATIGFSDAAHLDDGAVWPVAFALTKFTAADEARIRALVKKAVS